VAEHDVLDAAGSIEEHADLAADVVRDLGQLAGELVRDDPVFGKAATAETFEGFDLICLEAGGVAVDLDGVAPGADRDRSGVGSRPGEKRGG